MRKKLTSIADKEASSDDLLRGAANSTSDMQKFGLDPSILQQLHDDYKSIKTLKEKQEAELNKTSNSFHSKGKELSAEIGKWVSILEGQYGKSSEKLQEFGFPPRKVNPRKGPRPKK